MSWSDIWKIILCAIGSVGGIGVIIIAVTKFTADILAERLSQKYSIKLQKELEQYKSGLENKTYITKTKFDAEFSLYRELSKTFFEMVKDITTMIPTGYATYPADKEARKEYERKLYDNAVKSTVAAQDTLNGNIPFIPDELYQKYKEIVRMCSIQLNVFERRWNVLILETQQEKESFSHDDYQRSRDIKQLYEDLNISVREYLKTLDIIS